MSVWRLQRRSHGVDSVHAKLHEVLLAHLWVGAAWSSSVRILCRVGHTCVVDLSRCGTVAQGDLPILRRHVTASRFRDQIMLLLLLLLKIRRYVKRLYSAIVLWLHLLLESSLSLMSLMNGSITRDTPSTDGIIQETFGTDVSVLELVLDVR